VRRSFVKGRVLLLVLAAFTVLYGCAQVSSSSVEKQEKQGGVEQATPKSVTEIQPVTDPVSEPVPALEPTHQPNSSSEGGGTVGEPIAQAELRPVDDSGVSGTAVFKEVSNLGVQVDLELSGLSAPEDYEEPKPYFAQVHEGSCAVVPRGGSQEHGDDHPEHEHGAQGPSLALVRLGALLAKAGEHADHSEYHAPPADELPGNIDAPIGVVSSADGTAFTTTLLEGVEPDQLSSGSPKYMDLRDPSHGAPEDWPALACADLSGEG
jgi:hypothetical protein